MMAAGEARWIFSNIEKTLYSDEEKMEAIKKVAEMETHNSIKKSEMLLVIRWLIQQGN